MSYEPTSHRRNDASGTHTRSGSFDPSALGQKYPYLQPIGAHAGFAPIPLHRAITLVGSRRTARIHLNSTSVSKAHVLLVVTPHRVYAADLLSREGTFVKGNRISQLELRDGDELRVGNFTFSFHDPRPRNPFTPPAIEPAALEVDLPDGHRSVKLEKRVTLIGRRPGSDLQLPFNNVSTANTAVVRLEGFIGESDSMGFVGYAVFDLGGKGTVVNRRPVHKLRIRPGDEVTIGSANLRLISLAPASAAPTLEAAPARPLPEPVARAKPGMPAERIAPPAAAAPVPAAPDAPAVTDDFDDFLLEEELTPTGLEEDLLTGSHILPAIREPEQPESPLEPVAEAPAEQRRPLEEAEPVAPFDETAEEPEEDAAIQWIVPPQRAEAAPPQRSEAAPAAAEAPPVTEEPWADEESVPTFAPEDHEPVAEAPQPAAEAPWADEESVPDFATEEHEPVAESPPPVTSAPYQVEDSVADETIPGFLEDEGVESASPSVPAALGPVVDDWGEADEPFPLDEALIEPAGESAAASDSLAFADADEQSWSPVDTPREHEADEDPFVEGGATAAVSTTEEAGEPLESAGVEHWPAERAAEPEHAESAAEWRESSEDSAGAWQATPEEASISEIPPQASFEDEPAEGVEAGFAPEAEQWGGEREPQEAVAAQPEGTEGPLEETAEVEVAWPGSEALISDGAPAAESAESSEWEPAAEEATVEEAAIEMPLGEPMEAEHAPAGLADQDWTDEPAAEDAAVEPVMPEEPAFEDRFVPAEAAEEQAEPALGEPEVFAEASETGREEIDLSRLDFTGARAAAVPEVADEASEPFAAEEAAAETPVREPVIPAPEPVRPTRPAERPPRRKGTGRRKRLKPAAAAFFDAEAFPADEQVGEVEQGAAAAELEQPAEMEVTGEVTEQWQPAEFETREPVGEHEPSAELEAEAPAEDTAPEWLEPAVEAGHPAEQGDEAHLPAPTAEGAYETEAVAEDEGSAEAESPFAELEAFAEAESPAPGQEEPAGAGTFAARDDFEEIELSSEVFAEQATEEPSPEDVDFAQAEQESLETAEAPADFHEEAETDVFDRGRSSLSETADLQTAIEFEEVEASAEAAMAEAMDAGDEASAAELVSSETEPVPDSALNLAELERGETPPAPARLGPTKGTHLTDSAFALELEALSSPETGDLVPAQSVRPRPAAQRQPVQPPAPAPQKQAPAEAAPPAFIPATPARPAAQAPQATPPPARPTPASPTPPARPTPRPNWRDEWTRESSAFLGNLTPLDPTPSLPVVGPVSRFLQPPQRPAAQKPPERKPEPPEAVEHAPEGLGEEYKSKEPIRPAGTPQSAGGSNRSAAAPAPSQAGPTPSPSQAPPAAGHPVGAGTTSGAGPSADSGRRSGPAKPPRPKTVGFAGAVAEVDQSVAAGARNPFSSAPIASGAEAGQVLDPSAVMPESSGLVGLAEFTSRPGPKPTPGPVVSPASAGSTNRAETGREAPGGSDTAGAAARLISDEAALPADDDVADEEARIDEFLRTVRGGVSRSPAPAPAAEKGQNGHAHKGWDQPNGTIATPAIPAVEIKPEPSGRRRAVWMIPVLFGLMVVAMIAAVAAIYYGMQPKVLVTQKVRYEIPPTLSETERVVYQESQRQELFDPIMQPAALAALKRIDARIDPAYLGDATQYNKFALGGAAWSKDEPDVLLLKREVPESEREAEMARLKAVALSLYDRGGTARAERDRLAEESQRLEDEIAALVRSAELLNGEIEEVVASLPVAVGESEEARARQQQDLAKRIAALDEEWTAADRRVNQLKGQLAALESGNPLEGDARLADLKRQLMDIEARLASFAGGAEPARAEGEAEPAGSRVDEVPAVTVPELPEDDLPADARLLRELIETRMRKLTTAADAAGGDALVDHVVELNRLTASLVDEVLPRHVLKAGEVEMLHQSLLRARRQHMIERLEADEAIQTLRGEIALKERELGAAISDGLTERVAGLRMALKMSRDRLTLRTSQIEEAVAESPEIVVATQAYESARAAALKDLAAQRRTMEAAIAQQQVSLLTAADESRRASVGKAVAELESAMRGLVRDKTSGLPVAAEVWEADASEPAPADEAPEPSDDERSDAEPAAFLITTELQQPPPSSQPSLEQKASELRRQIEEREEQLRQEHMERLAELRQQLAAAEAAAAKAQNEARQARAQLTNLQEGEQVQERDRQRLVDMRLQKHDLDTLIEDKRAELTQARSSAAAKATPLMPTDADVSAPLSGPDDRPLIIVAALLGILAVFLIPLYFTLRSDSRG